MTCKRASSSSAILMSSDSDSGPTRSVKEPKLCSNGAPSSSEIITLNDLVLERCISLLHYIDRPFHERVSHRFANMLRYSYGKTAISLTILGTYAFCGPPQRCALSNRREVIFTNDDQVPLALRLIFKRFKRFRLLKICAGDMKYFMQAVLDSLCFFEYQPVSIRRLHLYLDDRTICKNSCRVIALFAHLLKELFIDASCMVTDKQGERFWSVVAKCSNLRTLSYNPEYDMYGTTEFVQKCLKKLKLLKNFRTGINIEFGRSQWLADCFSGSANLRKLSIANCYRSHSTPTFTLSSPVLLPLFGRLKTVALHFFSFSQLNRVAMDIQTILRALPEDGYLSVAQTHCGYLNYSRIRQYERDEVEAAIAQVLFFWLSMSERTKRPVVLVLYFDEQSFNVVHPLLKRLQVWRALLEEQFNGVSSSLVNGKSRLHLKDGRVTLTARRISEDDMKSVVRV